jgi:membrane-associated phospholipid phosphatase
MHQIRLILRMEHGFRPNPVPMLIAIAGVFGMLGVIIHLNSEINTYLTIKINQFTIPVFDQFWAYVTQLGEASLIIPLMVAWICQRPGDGFRLFWIVLLASLSSNILKDLFNTLRPAAVIPESINVIGPVIKNRAFPSGHSITAASAAGALLLYSYGRWVVSIGIVGALSRVMVGAHWIADVLFGVSIGFIAALIGYLIAKRYQPSLRYGEQIKIGVCVLGFIVAISNDTGYSSDWVVDLGTGLIAVIVSGNWVMNQVSRRAS